MTLEPYQKEAAEWLAARRRGLVQSPAGSGKTLVAAHALLLALVSRRDARAAAGWSNGGARRVGWMCNTREQADQAVRAVASVPELSALAEVQVECAAAGADWSGKDWLIIDECHHATAATWASQAAACRGSVWGFTATPVVGDDERDAALMELFDRQVFRVKRAAVAATRLVPGRVVVLSESDPCGPDIDAETARLFAKSVRRWRGSSSELRTMVRWRAIQDIGIAGNEARNASAVEAALSRRGNHVLVLVNETAHGEALVERLPGSQVVHAKLGRKRRREALEAFASGAVWCLAATSLADEGLDLPIADTLVLVSGGRSLVKAEQRTGRVLRSYPGKTEGLIFDFADCQHETMRRHSEARMALYQKLGYEVAGQFNLASG